MPSADFRTHMLQARVLKQRPTAPRDLDQFAFSISAKHPTRYRIRMSNPLSVDEITVARGALPGWTYEHDALTKTFKFDSFREAMGFMFRVAFDAEALNHHPDWSNAYSKVMIRLTTHDAGDKVTAKDVELAKRIQKISWAG